jgi:hypothetical protein
MHKNGNEEEGCINDEQKTIVALGAFGAQCIDASSTKAMKSTMVF